MAKLKPILNCTQEKSHPDYRRVNFFFMYWIDEIICFYSFFFVDNFSTFWFLLLPHSWSHISTQRMKRMRVKKIQTCLRLYVQTVFFLLSFLFSYRCKFNFLRLFFLYVRWYFDDVCQFCAGLMSSVFVQKKSHIRTINMKLRIYMKTNENLSPNIKRYLVFEVWLIRGY